MTVLVTILVTLVVFSPVLVLTVGQDVADLRASSRHHRAAYRRAMHQRADESLRVYREQGAKALLETEPGPPLSPKLGRPSASDIADALHALLRG